MARLAQKYLDFLNCAGASSSSLPLSGRTPQYRLNICREPSSALSSSAAAAAAAATLFYLESASSDTEDAELMQNLIRQEDERGEKNREKKLRHRMRRLTLSSSKVFSQKYATLIRRIEPKIPENATQSLSSIFAGAVAAPSSFRRRRKSRFPAASSKSSSPHNIVRSISNDTGVRPGHTPVKSFLAVPGLSEYQENTRSAPDLPGEQFQAKTRSTSNYSTDSDESLQLALEVAAPDSNGEDSQEEDNLQDNWIKPGETRSCENSQPDLVPRHHNLLEDFKSFSRRLQKLMHLKSHDNEVEKGISHRFIPSLERKPYYSSQPELPTFNES